MLKKLIIIEGKNEYQSDELQDIVKMLIDDNYYNMTQEEKINIMRIRAKANCLNINKKSVDIDEIEEDTNLNDKFVVGNEIIYILSLLTTYNVVLLERIDSDIFTKDIDKSKIEDNYIIVNKFAEEILEKMLKK